MNDADRKQWVRNDEGLYNDWLASRQPLYIYVRTRRREIDTVIENVTSGAQPAHYLAYPASQKGRR